MRTKLIALIGAGLLLTGCSAGETGGSTEPSTVPSSTPAQANAWADMSFCDAFEDQREDYQSLLDNPDAVSTSDFDPYRDWASAIEDSAPAEVAPDVETFTSPISMTESGTVDLLEVFAASNSIGAHCVMEG